MAGKFDIHPTGKSTIYCDTLDSEKTLDYVLITQDLKEEEREKIVYSEGAFDGSVVSSLYSIVTASFEILVNGNTQEDVAANLGVLKAAFFNLKGGYIEYRPVGYPDSILPTFYKYLRSSPPREVGANVITQPSSEDFSFSKRYLFQVKIFSLATSDPESPVTISSGDIYTFLQDGDNANRDTGWLSIPQSGIKGDGFIAHIQLDEDPATSAEDYSPILVHMYEVTPGNEGEEFMNEAFSGYTSFTNEGRHVMSSVSSAELVFNLADTYVPDVYGLVVPVFSYLVTSGTWEYKITQSGITLIDYTELTPEVSSPEWSLEIGETFRFPYFHLPPGKTSGLPISLHLRTTDSSSQTIAIYGLLLLKVDGNSWVAKFDIGSLSSGTSAGSPLILDGLDGSNYMTVPGFSPISQAWEKSGDSIKDMVFPKSDYQIRTLAFPNQISGPGTLKGWHHSADNRLDVVVKGVFYTIYPLSEA